MSPLPLIFLKINRTLRIISTILVVILFSSPSIIIFIKSGFL
jgi:hypothetical protein